MARQSALWSGNLKNAESRADFVHKLGMAQKECDECIYWIELLDATEYLTADESQDLLTEANSLLKMIRSAILTMKKVTHNS